MTLENIVYACYEEHKNTHLIGNMENLKKHITI